MRYIISIVLSIVVLCGPAHSSCWQFIKDLFMETPGWAVMTMTDLSNVPAKHEILLKLKGWDSGLREEFERIGASFEDIFRASRVATDVNGDLILVPPFYCVSDHVFCGANWNNLVRVDIKIYQIIHDFYF